MPAETVSQPPRSLRDRYHIETWGCQMNVHDSEKLAGALEEAGLVRASGVADADIVLLNTCSVRERAAEKFYSEIGRLRPWKGRRPERILGVCGCVAQEQGSAILSRAPHVDFVLGPRAAPGALVGVVARLRNGDPSARGTVDIELREDSIRFPFERIRRGPETQAKAYVTILEGCNHRCAYCIVPQTRGNEVCRDMDDVLSEVRALASRGVREVEFLGQTVNAFSDSRGRRLEDLLRAAAEVDGIRRIRFTTSHPARLTDPLIEAMAELRPKVCPYLHLPLQSGSSVVLRAMRRGYDRRAYRARVEQLRDRYPEIAIGTDVIVGFPGEGEEEFLETLSLLEAISFETVYSFEYSPRPLTPALALGDPVPQEVKRDRLARIQAFQKEAQLRQNREWIGRIVEVLVEGPSKRNDTVSSGRTPENRAVNLDVCAAPGTIVSAEVVGASAYSLRGRAVPRPS